MMDETIRVAKLSSIDDDKMKSAKLKADDIKQRLNRKYANQVKNQTHVDQKDMKVFGMPISNSNEEQRSQQEQNSAIDKSQMNINSRIHVRASLSHQNTIAPTIPPVPISISPEPSLLSPVIDTSTMHHLGIQDDSIQLSNPPSPVRLEYHPEQYHNLKYKNLKND